jgi:hypothetical protein
MSFPFEHIERRRAQVLDATASLEKVKKSQCAHQGCTSKPSLEAGVNKMNRFYVCLAHFIADPNASALLATASVVDQEALLGQNQHAGEMWREVISEVILDMFDLQRQEEEAMRKDPLSILGLNRPSATQSLAKLHGSAAVEKVSSSSSSSSSSSPQEKQRMAQKRKAPPGKVDPYTRIAQRRDDGALGAMIMVANEEEEEETAELKKAREAEEEKNASGLPCVACGSRWTETRTISLLDTSRSETWGFKDAPSTVATTCLKCKHVDTFTE